MELIQIPSKLRVWPRQPEATRCLGLPVSGVPSFTFGIPDPMSKVLNDKKAVMARGDIFLVGGIFLAVLERLN